MKRAVLSKPIYPAESYRQDYEELMSDGKTPAEDARDGVHAAAYVIALAGVALVALVWVMVDWMIFP